MVRNVLEAAHSDTGWHTVEFVRTQNLLISQNVIVYLPGAAGSVLAAGVSAPTRYCCSGAKPVLTRSSAPESALPTRPLTLCFSSYASAFLYAVCAAWPATLAAALALSMIEYLLSSSLPLTTAALAARVALPVMLCCAKQNATGGQQRQSHATRQSQRHRAKARPDAYRIPCR